MRQTLTIRLRWRSGVRSNTIDGKIYGVPDLNQCFGYFYNTEMFEQAGITPAETWMNG